VTRLVLAALFCLALVGCPSANDDDECGSYIWDWECENGDCVCNLDGSSCVDPDDTTEDDPQNCDNSCFECAE